jgi:exosortase family protein XrtF
LTKFLTFIVLTLLYQGFWVVLKNKIDPLLLVGRNTEQLLDLFPADVATEENKEETFIKLIYNHKYVARIIEGCNAISIIIYLFHSLFVFRKVKPTLLYFWRKVLVYVLNVMRIAMLSVLMYHFPGQVSFLHGVLFCLFMELFSSCG